MDNEELVCKILSDECPPGKFCHALCHDTYSNKDGRHDDCIACWTAWINGNGLPEKIEPKTLGDMTLREAKEYCEGCQECIKCPAVDEFVNCTLEVLPCKLPDETLDLSLNVDNDEDKC